MVRKSLIMVAFNNCVLVPLVLLLIIYKDGGHVPHRSDVASLPTTLDLIT